MEEYTSLNWKKQGVMSNSFDAKDIFINYTYYIQYNVTHDIKYAVTNNSTCSGLATTSNTIWLTILAASDYLPHQIQCDWQL